MKTEYLFILSIIMAVPFMGGCCLIYDYDDCASDVDGEFFVDADWKYASTANPEGMAYIFFSAYGHDKWRFDFPGRGGGGQSCLTGNILCLCSMMTPHV